MFYNLEWVFSKNDYLQFFQVGQVCESFHSDGSQLVVAKISEKRKPHNWSNQSLLSESS